jgi:hypothetical protein
LRKILYLIEQPLDPRNYDRFGIQTWITRGWTVEVWDLTGLAHPRVWQDFMESGRTLSKFEGYFTVTSRSQLDYRFSRLGKIIYFIDFTGNSICSLRAKMRLIENGAIRTICATGSIPGMDDSDEKYGIARRLREIFSRNPIKSATRLAKALVLKVAVSHVRPGLNVVSGEKSRRLSLSADHTLKILNAHNFDYDFYLQLRNSRGSVPGEYGVFLDQNICFAPDYIYEDVSAYATADKYFPAVCNGLKKVSAALQVPMLIAAHPRLPDRKLYVDYFRGIPVEYGRTAEVISNCRFVVCHYTTALQLAVLFRKPIIFVTTDQLSSSPAVKYIAKFASILGKQAINLDDDLDGVDWRKELNVDFQKYDAYKREYIKTDESPELPFWEIVIDHMENAENLGRRITSMDVS